jgi:hypothetical protein
MSAVRKVSQFKLRAAFGMFWVAVMMGCGTSDPGLVAQAGNQPAEPRLGARSGQCDAMSAKLRWDYESVQPCQHDEDCNYIVGYYGVVARRDLTHFVDTVGCGTVTPFLVVANGVILSGELERIQADQRLQALSCQNTVSTEAPCEARSGFVSLHPPVCRSGVCQAVRGEGYYGP